MKRVTDESAKRLREWLNENHRLFVGSPIVDEQFGHWLTEAENGQGVVEIGSLYSTTGTTLTFRAHLEDDGATHTPAPWFAWHDFDDDGVNENIIIGADFNGNVALVFAEGTERGAGEANARLIKAAPLLLEALRNVVRCVSMSGPAGTRAYIISDEFMAAAHTAIAAATDASTPLLDLTDEELEADDD
jgi:hypothetical protein